MRHISRDDYMAALRNADRAATPTPEQMLAACPHISREQALAAFKRNARIALPPVKVRRSYRAADASGVIPWLAFCTPESYAAGINPPSAFSPPLPLADEAMAYADEHWPEALVPCTWDTVEMAFLMDPLDVIRRKASLLWEPRTKLPFTVGFTGRIKSFVGTDTAVDNAIAIVSADPLVCREISGGPAGCWFNHNAFYCVHCGGVLTPNGCTHCGYAPGKPPLSTLTQLWPMPRKVITFLREECGHEFALDPERWLDA